jgi:pyruvate/2-oxoglutarate dehydrogenase complex dihydrolipoamide dehydrogenase (E3) component
MNYRQQLEPLDTWNQQLESHAHPAQWVNPKPDGRYNLVVIGGGTAGLVTAAGAAGLGAKVALIERGLLGGDCLNVGCVPSKAILAASRYAATVRQAGQFGTACENISVDFSAVMQRMRKLRAGISPHDSAQRFQQLGIDVYFGQATFVDSHTIQVGTERLQFRNAVIATGGRAAAPSIPGLSTVAYLTNETIFSLTTLPKRLVVIGGGPIGCEMAQAFARFGAQVTLLENGSHVLSREDRDAAKVVQASLVRDGIEVLCGATILSVAEVDHQKRINIQIDSQQRSLESDAILLAVGRVPNVDGLGLETIGIDYDARAGVQVDDRLRTSVPHIFAAGDVCSKFKFTHAADFMARIVIQNSLFWGRAKASSLLIPWCTYTSPELAHVGLTQTEAEQLGNEITTYTQRLSEVDRAILEGEEEGFVRVYCRRGRDQILGATIVASHAGDMISEITMAMKHRIGLKKIAATIHPYPTQAEAIRKIGDQYNRTRLTPTIKSLFQKWLAWNRSGSR